MATKGGEGGATDSIDKQPGPAAQHRERYSISSSEIGKESEKELRCYTPKTNTNLKINNTSI